MRSTLHALGCHLATGMLCRVPHPKTGLGIKPGFVRILRYRGRTLNGLPAFFWRIPYDPLDGSLLPMYWGLPRDVDILNAKSADERNFTNDDRREARRLMGCE